MWKEGGKWDKEIEKKRGGVKKGTEGAWREGERELGWERKRESKRDEGRSDRRRIAKQSEGNFRMLKTLRPDVLASRE